MRNLFCGVVAALLLAAPGIAQQQDTVPEAPVAQPAEQAQPDQNGVVLPDCTATEVPNAVDAYLWSQHCGGAWNAGFDTTFVPDDTRVVIRLQDVPEDAALTAYWVPSRTGQLLRNEVLTGQPYQAIREQPERSLKTSLECLERYLLPANVVGHERQGDATLFTVQIFRFYQDEERLNDAEASCRLHYEWWRPWRDYTLLVVNRAADGGLAVAAPGGYVTEVPATISSRPLAWVLASLVGAGLTYFLLVLGLTSGRLRLLQGLDGRLSLARTQIALFTIVVLTMLLYVMLREGTLGDISNDVLLLMGIIAAGSAGAGVADRMTSRLDWENWLWLKQQGWLKSEAAVPYRFSQLVQDSSGSFDVFRFQAVVFSLLVAGYLIVAGTRGLAGIDLPDGIMGILGLSQLTYIGGKAVAPPTWSDLNRQISEYRKAESEALAGGNDPSTDPVLVTARQKLESGFEAVWGYPPVKVLPPPERARARLEFFADTRDLFPLTLRLDGELIARLPNPVPYYENINLPVEPRDAIRVLELSRDVPGPPAPGPARFEVKGNELASATGPLAGTVPIKPIKVQAAHFR